MLPPRSSRQSQIVGALGADQRGGGIRRLLALPPKHLSENSACISPASCTFQQLLCQHLAVVAFPGRGLGPSPILPDCFRVINRLWQQLHGDACLRSFKQCGGHARRSAVHTDAPCLQGRSSRESKPNGVGPQALARQTLCVTPGSLHVQP